MAIVINGGRREGAGRKHIELDARKIEKLAAIYCSDEEIAFVLGCSSRTLRKLKKHKDYREAIARGRATGRTRLRRVQMQQALRGNTTMLIWLGKSILGQKEYEQRDFPSEINLRVQRPRPRS